MVILARPTRRGLLLGLGAALITAPAIVRAGSLMPVSVVWKDTTYWRVSLVEATTQYLRVDMEELVHWSVFSDRPLVRRIKSVYNDWPLATQYEPGDIIGVRGMTDAQ